MKIDQIKTLALTLSLSLVFVGCDNNANTTEQKAET